MKFCPFCGAAVMPDKKFCSSCGASLTPDIPASGAPVSPQTAQPVPASPGVSPATGLIAVAGVILLILGIILVGYPMLTGNSVLSAAGFSTTQTPVPVETTGSSWVEVVTVETTALPTTEPVIVTTPPTTRITTNPTTAQTTKPVVCPSDRVKCDNKCVDLKTDSKNCGYCGTACPSNQFCLNGNCMPNCSSGQTSCPGGCFDLQTNADHCGTCNNDCPAGLLCVEGGCRSPLTPMPNPI